MAPTQAYFLLLFLVINLGIFVYGWYQSIKKKNAFGLTYPLYPLGMFVWGDTVIFGLFWSLVSITCYFLQDWTLFKLTFSVFWVIRSLGETNYWFNQQFSSIKRNPPEKLPGGRLFNNDSIWFIYQICWQCVAVVAVISSIYLASVWLARF